MDRESKASVSKRGRKGNGLGKGTELVEVDKGVVNEMTAQGYRMKVGLSRLLQTERNMNLWRSRKIKKTS
jgi:hypothetical protein